MSIRIPEIDFNESLICYGTLEGRVALVSLDFSKNPLEPLHKWEIPEKGTKNSVTCIVITENGSELCIGRSDGNVEVIKCYIQCD